MKIINSINRQPDLPEWWQALPETEKAVLRNVIGMIRGLKKSNSPQIAQAAGKWDRGISCFIRTRLINQRRSTSSPSTARSRQGAVAAQN